MRSIVIILTLATVFRITNGYLDCSEVSGLSCQQNDPNMCCDQLLGNGILVRVAECNRGEYFVSSCPSPNHCEQDQTGRQGCPK